MLRPHFRFDRDLLKDLCTVAHESLQDYLRVTLDMPEGVPALIMTIHTFGDDLGFHPHLHAVVADGLFDGNGTFHVAPTRSLKPLENLFRARLLKWLVEKGKLPAERADGYTPTSRMQKILSPTTTVSKTRLPRGRGPDREITVVLGPILIRTPNNSDQT